MPVPIYFSKFALASLAYCLKYAIENVDSCKTSLLVAGTSDDRYACTIDNNESDSRAEVLKRTPFADARTVKETSRARGLGLQAVPLFLAMCRLLRRRAVEQRSFFQADRRRLRILHLRGLGVSRIADGRKSQDCPLDKQSAR
jgi:hypothetical protein